MHKMCRSAHVDCYNLTQIIDWQTKWMQNWWKMQFGKRGKKFQHITFRFMLKFYFAYQMYGKKVQNVPHSAKSKLNLILWDQTLRATIRIWFFRDYCSVLYITGTPPCAFPSVVCMITQGSHSRQQHLKAANIVHQTDNEAKLIVH